MRYILILLSILILSITGFAQEKDYLFKIGETEFGGYLGFTGKFTNVADDPAGFADIKAGLTFSDTWAAGLFVSGLYYDKKLDNLVNDGTYHLYLSYGGIFVEKYFPLNNNITLAVCIQSGGGEAYYQYDKDYRKEKRWSEEVIDRTTFHVLEPGIELLYHIGENYRLGISGSYRSGSPLELISTDNELIHNFNGGISFKWGIF